MKVLCSEYGWALGVALQWNNKDRYKLSLMLQARPLFSANKTPRMMSTGVGGERCYF